MMDDARTMVYIVDIHAVYVSVGAAANRPAPSSLKKNKKKK